MIIQMWVGDSKTKFMARACKGSDGVRDIAKRESTAGRVRSTAWVEGPQPAGWRRWGRGLGSPHLHRRPSSGGDIKMLVSRTLPCTYSFWRLGMEPRNVHFHQWSWVALGPHWRNLAEIVSNKQISHILTNPNTASGWYTGTRAGAWAAYFPVPFIEIKCLCISSWSWPSLPWFQSGNPDTGPS